MLINDILDFSKLEANQLNLIEKDYALDQQLTDLTRMMQPRLKPGVTMTLSLPKRPIYIHGDENRLAQVIMNLLSNSIKFTSQGHIQVSLDMNHDNHIIIAVRDTGIGMKEEDVNRLFTRFTQVANDSAVNMEGTGLGLAISMGIVKQMSGDIQVQSTAGEGSCFSIILPGRHVQDVVVNPADEQDTSERHLIQTCAFFVVDDMPMNCMVLDAMLMDLGALNVVAVNSGEEALAFIEKNMQTSMVLMDMRMPGMSGIEAAIAIRNIGYQGKIIAVTANASEQDRAACLDAGMDEFIAKPVAIDALEKVLIKLINMPDPITGQDRI